LVQIDENTLEFNDNDDGYTAQRSTPDKSDESKKTLWNRFKNSIKKSKTHTRNKSDQA